MDVSTDIQGIELIFKKLGHEIAEIRTRALSSLLSKIEHKLLHIADLLQERQLYIRLLEWFNFKPTPMQDEVLSFLLTLTKHSVPCEILASIGGVKFFSDLRTELESAMKPKCDQLLDRLLHVSDADLVVRGRCVYNAAKQEQGEEPTQIEDQNMSKQYQKIVSEYFKKVPSPDANEQTSDSYSFSFNGRNFANENAENNFLIFNEFPWHSLTATDRHVLTSTASSLCSPSPHLVRNACAFLLDVVFQDFPAEIFLQRPTIAQTLLTLLNSRPGGNLMLHAAQCLCALVKNLTTRFNFHRDPSMYCPKQGLPFQRAKSTDHKGFSTTPSSIFRSDPEGENLVKRPRGDGQEISSSSSSVSTVSTPISYSSASHLLPAREDLENDLAAYQEDQDAMGGPRLTLSSFCLSTLSVVSALLRIDSASLFLNLYEVTIHTISLLDKMLIVNKLWHDENQTAKILRDEVTSVLESLCDAVIYHYHHNIPTSALSDVCEWTYKFHDSKHDNTMHRVAYQASSAIVVRFLTSFVPVEKISLDARHSIRLALYIISCDEALRFSLKNIPAVADGYLDQLTGKEKDVVQRLRKTVNSIRHVYEFLREYEDFKSSSHTNQDKFFCMIELAHSGVDSVPYHSHESLIPKIVDVISTVSAKDDIDDLVSSSKDLLLSLLAHSLTHVRMSTYTSCLTIAQDVLNVKTAAENANESHVLKCRFLMDGDVLYEICHHGLSDSLQLVGTPAHDLIILLLNSKLLMGEQTWKLFNKAMATVVPVLQSYTGESERLQTSIFNYLDPNSKDLRFVQLMTSYMRAMMLKKRALRSKAGNYLVQLLSTMQVTLERDKPKDLDFALVNKSASIVGLTDLLITETPLSLNAKDNLSGGVVGSGVFSEDAMIRMLGIFRSRSLEHSVRRSALQQVSVMLTDPSLHNIFLSSDGLQTIIEHLASLVADNSVLTDVERTSTNACVSVIRSLCICNTEVRAQLHCDQNVLLMLLRASDLCRLSATSSSLISGALGVLLFHDVLMLKNITQVPDEEEDCENPIEETELSLPAGIVTRYQVSFLCPTHHTVSIHRHVTPAAHCDPLTVGPPAFAIRIAITVAKHESSIEEVLKAKENKELHLSEITALTCSYPPSAIDTLISSLINARSHGSVQHMLNLLRTLLYAAPCSYSSAVVACKQWKEAIEKFLKLPPKCVEDEILLNDLVMFLGRLLSVRSRVSDETTLIPLVVWLTKAFATSKQRPLLYVLESPEPQPETAQYIQGQTSHSTTSSSTIRRQLCKNVLHLTCHLSRLLFQVDNQYLLMYKFQVEMCRVLLIRLKLADAPQFYDLPSMEVSLSCLVHIVATFKGWSSLGNRPVESLLTNVKVQSIDNTTLCRQLMSTLLEIVSAFHIESRGSALSYMGKGVSRCATKCIVHLMREITKYSTKEMVTDFIRLLEIRFSRKNIPVHSGMDNSEKPNEYDWILPLWSARDPCIRYCGLAIASLLCQTENGCNLLANNFQNYPGSLWGMVLYVLLDHSECSLVRAQAANVFSNLISHKFCKQSDSNLSSDTWQGPSLQNVIGEAVSGISAVIALLHHMKFYNHMLVMLDRYYPKMCIQPLIINNFPAFSTNSISSFPSDSFASVMGSDIGQLTQQSVSSTGLNVSATSTEKINLSSSDSPRDDLASNLDKNFASADEIQMEESSNQQFIRENLMSPSSSLPAEWQAVSSPVLVTSVCQLLNNLVSLSPFQVMQDIEQNKIIFYLLNIMNPIKLSKKLQKFEVLSNSMYEDKDDINVKKHNLENTKNFLQSVIAKYSATCNLICNCATHDRVISLNVLRSEDFLQKILALLCIKSPSSDWEPCIESMQRSAMDFLSAAIQGNLKVVPLQITNVLSVVWEDFSAAIHFFLSRTNSNDCLLPTLRMLASIFSCIAVYDKNSDEKNCQFLLITHPNASDDSATICMKLVTIFESILMKPISHGMIKLTSVCAGALQSLLAISTQAKTCVIKGGFLDRILQEMKQLIDKLNILTTVVSAKSKKQNTKRLTCAVTSTTECEQLVQLITILCSLLNNIMHANVDAKKQAARAGVSQVISKLWTRTPVYNQLIVPLLKLMMTYTAECEQACGSLASTTCTMTSQMSLISCVIKLAREVNTQVKVRVKVPNVLARTVFALVTNTTCSQECRAAIWKMNLLSEFTAVADNCQHPKKTTQQHEIAGYWLRIFHMLSYHTDGQNNILKLKDILEIMVELFEASIFPLTILRVIRNLCFHNASKLRISSHPTIVEILKQSLLSEDDRHRTTAAQAIWALLTNSQKSKVHLKGASLTKQVEMVLAHMKLVDNDDDGSDYKTILSNILAVMNA